MYLFKELGHHWIFILAWFSHHLLCVIIYGLALVEHFVGETKKAHFTKQLYVYCPQACVTGGFCSICKFSFFHYFLFFLSLLMVMGRLISGWLIFSNQAALLDIVFQQFLFKFHILFFHSLVVHHILHTQCFLSVFQVQIVFGSKWIYYCKSLCLLGCGEKFNGE